MSYKSHVQFKKKKHSLIFVKMIIDPSIFLKVIVLHIIILILYFYEFY